MSPAKQSRFFLDKLPSEVCQKILSYLTPKKNDLESYYPFLQLAEANPALRSQVLVALSHTLKLSRRFEHLPRWVSLFYPDILELDITAGEPNDQDSVAQLLAAPNLARVYVNDIPRFLRALAHSPSLSALNINFFRPGSGAELLDVLPTLNLQTLTLTWHRKYDVCPLNNVSDIPQMLASCCPNVQVLEIDCACDFLPTESSDGCLVWPVVASFPALRKFKIKIWRDDPDDFIDDASSWFVPPQLNAPLTLVEASFDRVSLILEGHLDVEAPVPAGEGGHLMLIDSVPLLAPFVPSQLGKIYLKWYEEATDQENENFGRSLYHEPYHGSILRMISTAPAVEELTIMRVRVPITEIMNILTAMGPQVRIFGTAVENQEEAPDERLSEVLEKASLENPSLEELLLDFDAIIRCMKRVRQDACNMQCRRERLISALNTILFNNRNLQIKDFLSGDVWDIQDIDKHFYGDAGKAMALR